MLNFSKVEEPLFMFHKYSDYLFPIFVIGSILYTPLVGVY